MKSWWDLGENIGNLGSELAIYQIDCAFCGESGNFSIEHHSEKKKPNSEKVLNFDTLKCGNCASYALVLWSAQEYPGSQSLHSYRVIPYPLQITRAPEYMPESVGRSWLQVQKSLTTESWDAAAVMARTSMETALKDHKAEGAKLINKIEDLASKGLLPPLMKEWAHELRLLGNDGTHADPLSTGVKEKDAKDAAEFLDYLLEYLYSLPKQIKAYRDRRKEE